MYEGTIIEQSLTDANILQSLTITKKWTDEDWVLYDIEVREDSMPLLQGSLADGPWYIHLWKGEEMIIIFKEKIFKVSRYDTSTWSDAIDHGLSQGIPKEQLDFLTE